MIEDSLEEARQLRDASVQRGVTAKPIAARHIYKIYPEAGSEAPLDAVNTLLGACSGEKCCFADADVSVHGLCRLLDRVDASPRHRVLSTRCCRRSPLPPRMRIQGVLWLAQHATCILPLLWSPK